MTAAAYAKALREVAAKNPDTKQTFVHLRTALERRGHVKLLPAIISEYEKLELAEARSKARGTVTTESERTRVLLELYRHLVSTKNQ